MLFFVLVPPSEVGKDMLHMMDCLKRFEALQFALGSCGILKAADFKQRPTQGTSEANAGRK